MNKISIVFSYRMSNVRQGFFDIGGAVYGLGKRVLALRDDRVVLSGGGSVDVCE